MAARVLLLGGGGRMGLSLARCLLRGDVPGVVLAGAVDAPGHASVGEDLGRLAGAVEAGVALSDRLPALPAAADVAIDFSAPAATARYAAALADAGTAMVIGTTGFSTAEQDAVEQAAGRIPVVQAPNMSLGVNLLFVLAEQTAAALRGRGYDIEIIERHHRLKKDAPSGTAWGLGQAAARGAGLDLATAAQHGRAGLTGVRPRDEIGFHAVRGGDTVGDHVVLFAGEGEAVELSHRATSRETFARGALQAAAWVVTRPPGHYTMKDVLGL